VSALAGSGPDGPVRVVVDGGVATVTLDRPEARNAISTELAGTLAGVFEAFGTDRTVRAVVLTGAGDRAFCAGADLRERGRFDDHGWFVQREVFRRAFGSVRRCPLLVVAADDATLGLPEVQLGLVPAGGGTQLLARRVGPAVAKDLVLTGRRVDAAEARQLGLVDRLVPRADLLAVAHGLAAQIAANAPTAVRLAKWAIDLGGDLAREAGLEVEDQAWRRAVLSADRREGIAAWNDRRPPAWPGK
jgi:enoyl-CoA hydratase/carnithine racemase